MLLTLPHLAVSVYCNGTVSVRPSVCLSRRLDSNSSAQLVSGSRILTRDLAERSPQSAAPMAGVIFGVQESTASHLSPLSVKGWGNKAQKTEILPNF